MPSSSKPRKAHRPRAIARPVLERMRRDLILPAHLQLVSLTRSTDVEAQSDAMSTIVTLLNYMGRALERTGRDSEPIERGKRALMTIIDRHARHGVYRPTGEELGILRAAIDWCDQCLPFLDTRHLTDALLYVDRKMTEMGVTT